MSEQKVCIYGQNNSGQKTRGHFGPLHRTQVHSLERQRDGYEPLDGHDDDHPNGKVKRRVEEQTHELARHVREEREIGQVVEIDPEVETAEDEHHLVGERQHGHVEVGRLVAHLLAPHHAECHDVAERAHEEDQWQHVVFDHVCFARIEMRLLLLGL